MDLQTLRATGMSVLKQYTGNNNLPDTEEVNNIADNLGYQMESEKIKREYSKFMKTISAMNDMSSAGGL